MNELTPLKWLIKHSKKQHLKMALLIISNAVFSVLAVLFAFCIKEIIDSVTVKPDYNRFVLYALLICGVVVLQFGLRVLINGLTEHIRGKMEMEYRAYAFSKILQKKHEKISAYHSGELMNRLTADVSVISEGMSTIVPTVVAAVARLLSAVIALIMLDWIFAVAFSVAGILVFLVVSFMRSKLKSMHKKVQETDGKTRSFMQECIENLLAVKVFAVNDKIESQAAEMQKKNFKMKMIRKNYSVLGHSTHQFIFSAGYLFALLYGGAQILNGSGLTYGALSAILQLVNNVQVPFASLSNVLPKYYSMIASAERIIEIEEIEDEPVSSYVNRDELYGKMTGIKVSGVDFSYGRDMVLTDANLFINKGDFMMIEGTSGVGKSTLMKLMLGVYPVSNGSISAVTPDGEVELGCETRPLFSYVPQGNMLFSGTLRDNVTFIMDDASDSEIERALKISCSDEFINALPDGLDTKVGESGVGLSEGQIQRIAIARAILCNSPVILLDEATSALDEDTERRVLDNLKTIDGVTLIIVSHKKAAANICNRRVSVVKGKIIDQNKA